MSIRIKMFLGFIVVAALGVFLGSSFVQSGGAVGIREIVCGAAILVLAALASRRLSKKAQIHECILDAIPFPISVTDKERRWIFVNSAVEGMLKKTRGQLFGTPCSNWGATICNTDNCGIDCLLNGKRTTFFNQAGMDFKVHLGYLKDKAGKEIGHLELVEDMTDIFKRQKAENEMTSSISRSIVELSENASDVAAKTMANSELASKAASLTGSMKKNADRGSEQMTHMIAAVQEIKESAQTIGRVINTINDIAFQTNLLALNASVEAARAGEAGKGFAVVADEVRNLATRSAQAANDTNNIIRTSIEKSELGYSIAGETASSLTEMLSGLTSANQIVSDIARSSGDQATAIQNINSSLQEVSEAIRKTRMEEIGRAGENN